MKTKKYWLLILALYLSLYLGKSEPVPGKCIYPGALAFHPSGLEFLFPD
jgi:hypothetical protein